MFFFSFFLSWNVYVCLCIHCIRTNVWVYPPMHVHTWPDVVPWMSCSVALCFIVFRKGLLLNWIIDILSELIGWLISSRKDAVAILGCLYMATADQNSFFNLTMQIPIVLNASSFQLQDPFYICFKDSSNILIIGNLYCRFNSINFKICFREFIL